MISIELALVKEKKRLCVRVDERMSLGDFSRELREIFKIKNGRILMLSLKKNVSDDMSVNEAGLYNGCTVVIENGNDQC